MRNGRRRTARALLLVLATVLGAAVVLLGPGRDGPGRPVVRATPDLVTFAASPSRTAPVVSALPEPPPAPVAPAVPAALPTPIAPPADPRADEPEIVLGTIEIPRIGLSVPLNEGISLSTIDRGPSHWPGSALPGQVGNVVIAGHRVTRTRPFRDIDRLVAGDEVVLTAGGVRATYAVAGHEVVAPDAMRIVEPTPFPRVTLFACHPPGSARHRYVVTADLVRTEVVASVPS